MNPFEKKDDKPNSELETSIEKFDREGAEMIQKNADAFQKEKSDRALELETLIENLQEKGLSPEIKNELIEEVNLSDEERAVVMELMPYKDRTVGNDQASEVGEISEEESKRLIEQGTIPPFIAKTEDDGNGGLKIMTNPNIKHPAIMGQEVKPTEEEETEKRSEIEIAIMRKEVIQTECGLKIKLSKCIDDYGPKELDEIVARHGYIYLGKSTNGNHEFAKIST